MKITKGIYKSATCGECEAVLVETKEQRLVITDLNGMIYTTSVLSDFVHFSEEDQKSKTFASIKEFLGDSLLEVNLKFKG